MSKKFIHFLLFIFIVNTFNVAYAEQPEDSSQANEEIVSESKPDDQDLKIEKDQQPESLPVPSENQKQEKTYYIQDFSSQYDNFRGGPFPQNECYSFDESQFVMPNSYCCPKLRQGQIEFKGGYFIFQNSKLKRIYNSGAWDIQLSGSYPLSRCFDQCSLWKRFDLYGSVEYLHADGKSLTEHERTTFRAYPISLGLKAYLPLRCGLRFYSTLGPRYVFVNQKNHSDIVPNAKGSNIGGFINVGVTYSSCNKIFLDAFTEYSYVKVHFKPHHGNVVGRTIQVGGFCFGLGAGYYF